MITDELQGFTVATNIGRPSYYDEKDFLLWDDIYDFVETSEIALSTNGIYDHVRELCANRKGYIGGGYRFEFAFFNEEDCAAFEEGINQILERHGRRRVETFERKNFEIK